MRQRERPQFGRSFRRKLQQDLPSVFRIGEPLDEARRFQPVHQFDGGVMAKYQAVRQFADGRLGSGRQALKREQGLVLLRLDIVFPGPNFAEVKKVAKLVAKLSQLLIVLYAEAHLYIVARYIFYFLRNTDSSFSSFS